MVVHVDDTAAVEVATATDVGGVIAVESTTVVVEELVEESPDDEVLHPANTVTVITRRVHQRRISRLSPNRVSQPTVPNKADRRHLDDAAAPPICADMGGFGVDLEAVGGALQCPPVTGTS